MKTIRFGFLLLLAAVSLPLMAGCKKSYEMVPEEASPLNDKQKLIADLTSKDQGIRGIAANRLGSMGAAAQDALPELEKAVKKEKAAAVKLMMQEAIKKIKGG